MQDIRMLIEVKIHCELEKPKRLPKVRCEMICDVVTFWLKVMVSFSFCDLRWIVVAMMFL